MLPGKVKCVDRLTDRTTAIIKLKNHKIIGLGVEVLKIFSLKLTMPYLVDREMFVHLQIS